MGHECRRRDSGSWLTFLAAVAALAGAVVGAVGYAVGLTSEARHCHWHATPSPARKYVQTGVRVPEWVGANGCYFVPGGGSV